jgi:hypothetical protein
MKIVRIHRKGVKLLGTLRIWVEHCMKRSGKSDWCQTVSMSNLFECSCGLTWDSCKNRWID